MWKLVSLVLLLDFALFYGWVIAAQWFFRNSPTISEPLTAAVYVVVALSFVALIIWSNHAICRRFTKQ